jgi:hypothetical protein
MVQFKTLLEWLQLETPLVEPHETPTAGIGLFSRRAIPPSTPLFTIPARALLNSKSLAPHYPPGLTAVQLIALHLTRYRALPIKDPLFGPYISTLPREFDSHPLTCHVHDPAVSRQLLPPSIANALAHLHSRYLHDWHAVCVGQRDNLHLDRGDEALQCDFLWAWLNGKRFANLIHAL